MLFTDRQEAGKKLADQLQRYQSHNTVVLAISRSAIVIAMEIVKVLNKPLGLVLVQKIPNPLEPEYAIGVVAEGGEVIYNSPDIARFGEEWRQQAEVQAWNSIKKSYDLYYKHGYKSLDVRSKTVILVADGIATGLALEVGAYCLRNRQPEQIIVAAPVASQEGLDVLQDITNHIVIVDEPKNFMGAVSAHYKTYPPVSPAEACRLLTKSRSAIGRQYT